MSIALLSCVDTHMFACLQNYDMEPKLLGVVVNQTLMNAIKGYAVTCFSLVVGKLGASTM